MPRFLTFLIGAALISSAMAQSSSATAWRTGQPRSCLKNGDALLGWFNDRAKNLGPSVKKFEKDNDWSLSEFSLVINRKQLATHGWMLGNSLKAANLRVAGSIF